jgi:WD repeat-containing protein 35
MEVCDSIGTPVDSRHINIQPFHASINANAVVVSSTDSFIVWYYSVPRRSKLEGHSKVSSKNEELTVYQIDDHRSQRNSESGGSAKRNRAPFDNICCVCVGNDFILIVRFSLLLIDLSFK